LLFCDYGRYEIDLAEGTKKASKISTRVRSPSLPNKDCWCELSGPPPHALVQKFNQLRGMKKAQAKEKTAEEQEDEDWAEEEPTMDGPVTYAIRTKVIYKLTGQRATRRSFPPLDLT
jgi:hypothetical protein